MGSKTKPIAFNSNAGKGLQLGPVIKALGISPTVTLPNGQVVDYSNQALQYTDNNGISTPATKATIGLAINQLAVNYPQLGEWVKSHFGITTGTSKESTAAWDSLASANFVIEKAVSPEIRSAQSSIKKQQTVITNLENQIQFGTSTATAAAEVNAFDSIKSILSLIHI